MSWFGELFRRQNNVNGRFRRSYYSIVSKKAEKVIDIAQDGPAKGSAIVWDGYNGDNQAFTIIQKNGIILSNAGNMELI